MAPLWTLVAVFLAGTVKGIAGLGFPTLATPLLSLAVDVKTAVALLILPNIVMDGIQFARRADGDDPPSAATPGRRRDRHDRRHTSARRAAHARGAAAARRLRRGLRGA